MSAPDRRTGETNRYAQRDARRVRVMRMFNSGMTRTAIADRVGVSASTVRKDIDAMLREYLTVPTEQYVARQLSQIEDLRRAVYANALQGDLDSFDRAVRLMDREAKLLGLDAPARAVVHVSTEDFAATAATLMRDMGMTPPDTIAAAAGRIIDPDDDGDTPADIADADPIIAAADTEEVDDGDWIMG